MNRPALVLLTALALVAVGGVFLFVQPFLNPPAPEEHAPVIPAAVPYEAVMDKALAGYNARDAAKLFADFAPGAVPAPTDGVYRALFEGYYRQHFGAFVSRKLSPAESEIVSSGALLVWNANFSRAKPVKLSANFITESGQPRIVQLRIEKPETAK